jgi:hypothetical protein
MVMKETRTKRGIRVGPKSIQTEDTIQCLRYYPRRTEKHSLNIMDDEYRQNE